MPKYIVTTGGVMSGLGKGIASASLGKILQSYGYDITMIKVDPYINVDAGTMNPFEHGEVFVLDDGGECDMDLGNYERFLNKNLSRDNNITTGKVYKEVIDKERKGDYLGKTVQIIPHVTNEIQRQIKQAAKGSDITIIELGGTVGDIESMPFLEACRQLHLDEGDDNVLFVHVTLVPVMEVVGEQKTKPTQHSVQRLQEAGIQPDLIVARSKNKLEKKTKRKIANFCNVRMDDVISDPNAKSIYEVPLILQEENIGKKVAEKMNLKTKKDLKDWKKFVNRVLDPDKEITIALAGKYTALGDSYVSILESLKHAGAKNNCKVNIKWIETEGFEEDQDKVKVLDEVSGLIVPGGFGSRGAEGKIKAINYARENDIPFLGLCYGFQLAAIGFARSVCDLEGANTTENEEDCEHEIICILPEQYKIEDMGGTMRLGAMPCKLEKGTLAYELYGKKKINERHRHRYELNPEYIETLEENGLKFSGRYPKKEIMEVLELPDHPFFLATQFHPEFKSRPEDPSPPFVGFVKACLNK